MFLCIIIMYICGVVLIAYMYCVCDQGGLFGIASHLLCV